MQLWDFQNQACRELWLRMVKGNTQSMIMQAPTGAGKSVLSAAFIQKLHDHLGWQTLVFAHRRELVRQTADKLRMAGIEPGIIMSGERPEFARMVQVASIQTYQAWNKRGMPPLRPQLCLIDECHHAMSASYQKVITELQATGCKILGTTATPIRTDGKGLADSFEDMIQTPQMPWMIENGFLCKTRYFVGIVPDVSGVRITAGDYSQAQLQAVMNQKLLIGDVIDNYLKHSAGRKFMVFASGVEHSKQLTEAFNAKDIVCAHVDAHTEKEDRDAVYENLRCGKIQGVSNAQVYVEGTDIPFIECVIFAHPTKSIARYLQMGGRGMRIWPGKKNVHFHDHSGVVHTHGVVEMEREWKLTEGKDMLEQHAKQRDKQRVQFTCSNCGCLYHDITCPQCGEKVQFPPKLKHFLPADLVDMSTAKFDALTAAKKKRKAKDIPELERRHWYAQMRTIADKWGKKEGFAAHTFKTKFGDFPPFAWNRDKKQPPIPEVESYCRGMLIRRAKGMAKRAQS